MKQLGKRRPDHSITVITESEAKIDITVGPPKIDLIQAAGFFKDLVEKGDDRLADSLKSQQVLAQRELTTASQRLSGTKPADKSRDT